MERECQVNCIIKKMINVRRKAERAKKTGTSSDSRRADACKKYKNLKISEINTVYNIHLLPQWYYGREDLYILQTLNYYMCTL